MPEGLRNVLRTFFDLDQIAKVLPDLLKVGLLNTIFLTIAAVVIGLVVGLLVAVLLISRRRWVRAPARVYVDGFRGLPTILTIYLIGQGLPIAGIDPFGPNAYAYAALALGLIEGAYMSEIFRSGIQAVDRGQLEAARGLGLSYLRAMRHVVVPQGVRHVLPALTGQFIHVVKGSALVYLLGLLPHQRELFTIAQDATTQAATLSPMVAAGAVYLMITVPLTYAVNALDRRLRNGSSRDAQTPVTPRPVAAVHDS